MDALYDVVDIIPSSQTSGTGYDSTEASTDDGTKAGGVHIPPRTASSSASNKIVTEKTCYDFFCKFRKNDLDKIRKGCNLNVIRRQDDFVEVRFNEARTGTCAEWKRQFSAICDELKLALVVERVEFSEVENVNKLLSKLKSQAQSLLIKKTNAVDIVCRREALEGIKDIIGKHKVKKSKQRLSLPVGYDVNGACRLYIYVADITKLNVDVIVNVTDEFFQLESGTSKAIAEAAGPEMDKALREYTKKIKLKTSDVFSTTAGNLRCKAILHAVKPRWPGDSDSASTNKFKKNLTTMFQNVLTAAATTDKEGCENVALSTSDFHLDAVPSEIAANALKDAILKTVLLLRKSKLKEVHVVDNQADLLTSVVDLLGDGGSIKISYGKSISIKTLSEDETQAGVAASSAEDSSTGKPVQLTTTITENYRKHCLRGQSGKMKIVHYCFVNSIIMYLCKHVK